jgi:hypothetical protein
MLVVAAVEAIYQLLSTGSSYEHTKLMEAGVFLVAIGLHQNPSQRQLSLRLLDGIIPHLGYVIIIDEGLAETLFSLFEFVLDRIIQSQN